MKTKNTVELESYNPPAIRRSGGRFIVKLDSLGNPDYGQDPDRAMPGVPTAWAHVGSLKEAQELCRQFKSFYDLGAGNWAGGEVTTADGVVVGFFSYNGRLWSDKRWTPKTKEIAV